MKFLKKYWWFLILIILAVYVFQVKTQQGTISSKFKEFSIADVNEVTKIEITNNTASVFLEKIDETWTVNNNFSAKPEAVDAFLLLLNKIQVKSPLPLAVADSLTQILKTKGVEVKVFSKSKQLRHFFVHHTTTLNLGGIGVLEDSDKAFMLEFPNYNDDIVKLFYIQPSAWAENRFSIPASKTIQAVEVEIPDEPEKSFRIDYLEDGKTRLFDLYNGKASVSFETVKLHQFTDVVKKLAMPATTDSLSQQQRAAIVYSQPSNIITFHFERNEKVKLTFFPIPVEEYLDELGRPVRFDLNRLYVTVSSNPSEMYEAKYIEIHPILKDISYFNPIF